MYFILGYYVTSTMWKDYRGEIYFYSGSNYSNLTRPHPKWWFSKGDPLISGKSRLVTYYNLARLFQPSIFGCVPGRVKSTGDVSFVDFLVTTSMIKHIPNQRPKRLKLHTDFSPARDSVVRPWNLQTCSREYANLPSLCENIGCPSHNIFPWFRNPWSIWGDILHSGTN